MESRSVELVGAFILPSLEWSDSHLGTLCFRCEIQGKTSDMLLPVISVVHIAPEDIEQTVRITGCLRKVQEQRIFEMTHIKRRTMAVAVAVAAVKSDSKAGGIPALEGRGRETEAQSLLSGAPTEAAPAPAPALTRPTLRDKSIGSSSSLLDDSSTSGLIATCLYVSPVLHMQFGRLVLLELEAAYPAPAPAPTVSASASASASASLSSTVRPQSASSPAPSPSPSPVEPLSDGGSGEAAAGLSSSHSKDGGKRKRTRSKSPSAFASEVQTRHATGAGEREGEGEGEGGRGRGTGIADRTKAKPKKQTARSRRVFIALRQEATLIRPYICPGHTYAFHHVRRSRWRSHGGSSSGESYGKEGEGDSEEWYTLGEEAGSSSGAGAVSGGGGGGGGGGNIRESAGSALRGNTGGAHALKPWVPFVSSVPPVRGQTQNEHQSAATTVPSNTPQHAPFPASVSMKFLSVASAAFRRLTPAERWREVHISGYVRDCDANGSWVRLVATAESATAPIPLSAATATAAAAADSHHHYYSEGVLLYLSHRTRPGDIQYSLRQGCRIRASAVLPVFLWGAFYGLAATVRSHVSVAAFGSADSVEPLGTLGAVLLSPINRRVPDDQRRRCHLYSAWKLEAWRQLRRSCLCDPRPELVAALCTTALLRLQDRRASSNTYPHPHPHEQSSDRDRGGASKEECCFIDVAALLTLPEQHNLQVEFSDPLYGELFAMRGGESAEWIDQLLPQLWSLGDARVQMEGQAQRRACLAGAGASPSARFQVYVQEDTGQRSGPVDLAATIRRVTFMPQYSAAATAAAAAAAAALGRSQPSNAKKVWKPRLRRYLQEQEELVTDDSEAEAEADAQGVRTCGDAPAGDTDGSAQPQPQPPQTPPFLLMLHLEDRLGSLAPLLVPADYRLLSELRRELFAQPRFCAPGTFELRPPAVLVARPTWVAQLGPSSQASTSSQTSGASVAQADMQLLVLCQPGSVRLVGDHQGGEGGEAGGGPEQKAELHRWASSMASSPAEAAAALRLLLSPGGPGGSSIPVSAPPGAQAAAAVAACDLVDCTDGLSVRHALMENHSLGENSSSALFAVEGWVVHKEVTDIDTNRFQTYGGGGGGGGSSGSGSGDERRISILLQDMRTADTIKAYVPLQFGRALFPGMAIRLGNCVVTVSASGTVYLNCCQHRKPSSLGFLGIRSCEHMLQYCAGRDGGDGSVGGGGGGDSGAAITGGVGVGVGAFAKGVYRPPCDDDEEPPPRTTVSRLQDSRLYNRCTWRLLGRVVQVEKVQVHLKCTVCNVPARSGGGGGGGGGAGAGGGIGGDLGVHRCPRCRATHTLQPEWTAVVCFDDGTGECFLFVDTAEDVFKFLRPSARPAPYSSARSYSASLDTAPASASASASASAPSRGGLGSPQTHSRQTLSRQTLQELVEDRVRSQGFLRYMFRFRQSKINAQKEYQLAEGRRAAVASAADAAGGAGAHWWEAEEGSRAYVTPEELLHSSRAGGEAAVGGGGGGKGSRACDEELLLDEYIEECDFSSPMEVQCRLIFLKGSQGKGIPTQSRDIKIQADNSDKPYMSFTEKASTYRADDLNVQVTAARAMGSEELHGEAWHLLRTLPNHGQGQWAQARPRPNWG